jgi:hypothetical protein
VYRLISVAILAGVFLLSGIATLDCLGADHEHRIVTVDDIEKMTPDELRTHIQECHDMCRIGKAERLEAARQRQEEQTQRQRLVSQWQYDANYYEINFAIDFTTEIIDGYVTMSATSVYDGLTSAEIDLYDNMDIDSITMGGEQVAFSRLGDLVTVTLDQTYNDSEIFTITTYYNGHPTEGGFQAFSFETHSSTDIASTLSEPYFARTWWPCKDYPDDKADSADIIITHPDDFVCSSNGTLVSIVDNGDGTETTHWHESYPITTYLVSICVTNYMTFSNWYVSPDGDSMPVEYWVYPENWASANASFPVTVDMIEVCADRFVEYPFIDEKYGMSQFPWGGAMEHQTNTSMSSYAYYESIIVHELAHQWWGDMITCENWHEIWMNEGFASYAEALWVESQSDFSAYRNYMNSMRYTSGGTIYCQDTTSVWAIFSSRVYDKGAWVLHMLRHVVGDSTFFDILQTYGDDPRYRHGDITTVEFRDLCEDVSGMNLHPFFDDWIFGEYYPYYRYSFTYEQYGPTDYVVYLHLRQSQNTDPQVFDMPVDIDIFDGSTYHSFTVNNNQRGQDYILYVNDASNPPASVSVDRFDWILKSASSESYGFHFIYEPLESGSQYVPYLDSVIARGGTEPYEFTVLSGDLPDGVELGGSTGMLTGAPNQAGMFTFTIRAQDAAYHVAQNEYVMFVAASNYRAGDANASGDVDIDDAIYLISFIFSGGPDPIPLNAGDANGSCEIDIDDAVHLIAYIFSGGPDPIAGCVE